MVQEESFKTVSYPGYFIDENYIVLIRVIG